MFESSTVGNLEQPNSKITEMTHMPLGKGFLQQAEHSYVLSPFG